MIALPQTFYDDFTCKGEWWHPSTPTQKAPGTLSVRCAKDISLTVHGDLDAPETWRTPPRDDAHSTIHGVTHDLRPVTLFDTFWTERAADTQYAVNLAIFGGHFDSQESVRFGSVELRLTYLEEWLGGYPFRQEIIGEGKSVAGVDVRYRYPEAISVTVPESGLALDFLPGFNVKSTANVVTLTHHSTVILKPSEPLTLERTFELAAEMQQLMTLLVGAQVYFKKITATMPGHPRERYELFFLQWEQNRAKKSPFHDIAYNRAHLADRLPNTVVNWFNSIEKLRPVYEAYFSTIMASRMYVQSRFLHLSQAIESFHRRTVGGSYLPDDKFALIEAEMVRKIPGTVPGTTEPLPEGLRAKLGGNIHYSNEPSLRKRLISTFDSLADESKSFICADAGEFISAIVDTRNYLTHLGEKPEHILADHDLFNAAQALDALFRVMLLKHLGLPEELTVQRLRSTTFRGFAPFAVGR